MVPVLVKVAAIAAAGWGASKVFGKKKSTFQSMNTVGANGHPVTVMTPVSSAVTVAQARATAPAITASPSAGLPQAQVTPSPAGGQTFAAPGAITQTGPGTFQLAPIVITSSGASSTAIGTVTDVQRALNTLSYQPTLTEDGVLGPLTIANIKQFQSKSGLVVDGNAGPATKAALATALTALSGGASSAGATAQNSNPSTGTATTPTGQVINTTSALAMSNKDVQHSLNQLGASPALTEDGVLGPISIAAIKSFQTAHGLTPDGIAGPNTKTALYVALQPSATSGPIASGISDITSATSLATPPSDITASFGFGNEFKHHSLHKAPSGKHDHHVGGHHSEHHHKHHKKSA